MKREILFRAQRVDNGEWVYGYYSYRSFFVNEVSISYITNEENEFKVLSNTVCQFTGLTDKNGTKIFEGDIIFNDKKTILTCKEDPRLYLVKWENGEYGCNKNSDTVWLKQKPSFIFEKINPIGKNYMSLIFNQSNIEVIGDIFDSSELLK